MSWVRIDDAAMDHPKVLALSDAAFRVWVKGLCYCQRHLTDGFIPREVLKTLLAKPATIAQLVTVNLWHPREGGYLVHDYLVWNDSRSTVEQKRNASRARADASRSYGARAAHVQRTDVEERAAHAPFGVVSSTPEVLLRERRDQGGVGGATPRPREFGRIVLHRWQLDALIASLGPHAATFDLDAWVLSLSATADQRGLVLDRKTLWPWVQAELRAECQRRGLPVANGADTPTLGKQSTRLLGAVARMAGEPCNS